MACPHFLPEKSICAKKLDKYGKEELAKIVKNNFPINNSSCDCEYSYRHGFKTCPDFQAN